MASVRFHAKGHFTPRYLYFDTDSFSKDLIKSERFSCERIPLGPIIWKTLKALSSYTGLTRAEKSDKVLRVIDTMVSATFGRGVYSAVEIKKETVKKTAENFMAIWQ